MSLISLQLDTKAQDLTSELIEGLEDNDGWLIMNTRLAAQIDSVLTENKYVGTVHWYSESDFIEKEIHYSA
ncbi:hypothetical protein KP803_00505 [Vibrio sp. ZSDE26]|uniref:Uncharacterized protein n=1 Tax=Vibrio amylolyticus TaxID=2847292 RepID=A0A9X1XEY6_9VIBR|nr:hypothetical protein [Vibrio amylolyticus]MCK6261747.1 hypothetical protein [Vibrio amylolyticus]